jgi:hypothetical protein
MARSALWLSGLLCLATIAVAQDPIDSRLLQQIYRIPAIDNHTHAEGFDATRPSRWNDANPLGNPRYPDVARLARTFGNWNVAWFDLYAYAHKDTALPHVQELLAKKRAASNYFQETWPKAILERANVRLALVNAVRLGKGIEKSHFRWVPYADPLLRPFAGDKSWLGYAGGDLSIADVYADIGVAGPPPTLAQYREQVVDVALKRWKDADALAVKILSGYVRGIDFDPVPEAIAGPIYLKALAKETLSDAEQKTLENHLFNSVSVAAGKHGLVVHVHTGNGDGPFFNNTRANPGLLENALNWQGARDTKFVLLHGGWPYHAVTQAMLDKPNTYADFSAQTFYLSQHQLSEVLRGWLSWHPEKVLFGSDAYSDVDSPLTDWEEKQVQMTYNARLALGVALTAMMRNREISRERALEIARMVLHDNAAKLYGLPPLR